MKNVAKCAMVRLWVMLLFIALSQVSCLSGATAASHRIGEEYGGGIVFYVDGTGKHGLIAAKSDQGNYDWVDAISVCKALTVGGYSDWYLPNIDELSKLYKSSSAVGVFAVNSYWSSSEFNALNALCQWFFLGGNQIFIDKSSKCRVRAVRAF